MSLCIRERSRKYQWVYRFDEATIARNSSVYLILVKNLTQIVVDIMPDFIILNLPNGQTLNYSLSIAFHSLSG